jgi:hypothetical protein
MRIPKAAGANAQDPCSEVDLFTLFLPIHLKPQPERDCIWYVHPTLPTSWLRIRGKRPYFCGKFAWSFCLIDNLLSYWALCWPERGRPVFRPTWVAISFPARPKMWAGKQPPTKTWFFQSELKCCKSRLQFWESVQQLLSSNCKQL